MRMVSDNLNRQVSQWTGTDDTTGVTGEWSPTNQGSANLLDIQDNYYDSTGTTSGIGDSNLTFTIQHPDNNSADDRVTQNLYDGRDREVASKDGVRMSSGTPYPAGETDGVHRPIVYSVLDNLGEVSRVYQYDGDMIPLGDFATAAGTDAVPTVHAGAARALSLAGYDDQGRAYVSSQLSVDQTYGLQTSLGVNLTDAQILALPALVTNNFRDQAGNLVAVYAPGGLASKEGYDAAERLTKASQTDGGAVNGATMNWANANSVTYDIVLSQTVTTLDANGNPILVASKQRFDNDPTTSSGEGDLGGPTSGYLAARVYYVANYYDAGDRGTDSVNVGTNGGSAYTRPSTPAARSDTALVTSTGYAANEVQSIDATGAEGWTLSFGGQTTSLLSNASSASDMQSALAALSSIGSGNVSVTGGYPQYLVSLIGLLAGANQAQITANYYSGPTPTVTTRADGQTGWQATVTDPRGLVTRTDHDLLGRDTRVIGAFDGNGTPTNSANQTTDQTYDGDSNVLTMTALMPTGNTPATPNQVTQYVMGVGTTGTLFSNDLVGTVRYPDKTLGTPSSAAADDQIYTYNNLAQKLTFNDHFVSTTSPGGSVHAYKYDVLSRMTLDGITSLGSGVDGTVLSHAWAFDGAGRESLATSYSAANGTGTVENQNEYIYNGLSQLVKEYEARAGVVTTGSSPFISWTYNVPTSTSNNDRLTVMTYPNTRPLAYGYNLGLDSAISRVSFLADGAGTSSGVHLEEYTYLGLDTIVVKNRPEDHTQLTYIRVTGDSSYHDDGGDGRYVGLDRFGRVDDQFWLNTGTGGGATDRFQYGFDRDGNVLYMNNLVHPAASELYHVNAAASGDDATAYDNDNRLKAFERGTLSASIYNGGVLDTITSPNASQSYNLDAVGNFNSITDSGTGTQTRTPSSQNQIGAITGNSLGGGSAYTPVYDNAGNATRSDLGNYRVYDGWNMLVAVKDTANSATLNSFTIDATGMVATSGGGTNPAYWFYTPDNRLIETWYTTGIYNQYVWGLGYVNSLILRDRNSDGNMSSGDYGLTHSGLDERLYVQQDANCNVTAIVMPTTGSQTVELRWVYDPYGKYTTLNSSWATTTDPGYYMRFLFQGEYYDYNSYMMGARWYSFTMGTWFQKDPAGYLDGSNVYRFAQDDPVQGGDPSGLAYDVNIGDSRPNYHIGMPDLSARVDKWAAAPKSKLRAALAALCAKCKASAGFGAKCGPADCAAQAQVLADAIVDAIAQHRKTAGDQPSSWRSNVMPFDFACGDWQQLTSDAGDAANTPYVKAKTSAFRVNSVEGKNYLQHHWTEIGCRSAAPGTPGSYIVIDPYPTGGKGDVIDPSSANDWPAKYVTRTSYAP